MAVNKNFVVKNGLEVNTDLIFADPSSNRVGIASTIPSMLLDVQGGIACTDIQVSGVATIATGIITSAVCNFLNVTGISTLAGALSFEDLVVSGIGTIRTGILTEAYIHFLNNKSGVSTVGNLVVAGPSTCTGTITVGSGVTIQPHGGLSIAGIMTVGGNLNVVGDITYDEVTGRNLNITGVSTLASVKVSDLTSGRVVTAGTGGELQDASTFTFSGGTVTATAFAGDLTGDVTGDVSGNAGTFTVTANNTADETVYPVFVDGATGSQGAESDTGLNYNPSSGILAATKFSGDGSLITGVASTDNIVTGTAVTITNNVKITGITTISNNVNISGISTLAAIADQTGSVGTAASILSSTGTSLAWINANTTSVDNATKVGTNADSTNASQYVAFVGAASGNNPVRINTGLRINPSTNALSATSFTGAVDLNGGVLTLDADADTTITADTDDQIDIAFAGNDRITLSTGLIDLKNDGSKSAVRLYCESSNAHYTAIEAAAHSEYSGNATVTLPASTTTLVGRDTTDTLTNKSLTSPTITGTGAIAGTFTGNLTGNASGSSGSCTGNAATADAVDITATSTDATYYVVFADTSSTTAGETMRVDAGITYNPSTNILAATSFTGAVTGNADTATTATNVTVADESSDTTCFPLFATAATGNLPPKSGSNLTFNSSTGVLAATSFTGNVTGNVTGNCTGSSGSCTGNAASSDTVDITATSSDATYYVVFADTSSTTAGETMRVDGGITYNPSTNVLAATSFTGNVTGNVTGNCTGSSGSCTGNSATATEATNITVTPHSTDSAYRVPFVSEVTGTAAVYTDTGSGMTYNPSTNTLVAGTFSGSGASLTSLNGSNISSGTVAAARVATLNQDTTGNSATFTATANNSTNETVYPVFVDGATGSQGAETDTGLTYNPSTGLMTATAFSGDGSALTGLSAGGSGEFNTSISGATQYDVTTSMATAFTANASTSHRTIVHSIHIANITGSDVTISGEMQSSFSFAHTIPVPGNSAVELLHQPKVLGPSETIELQASSASALEATIVIEYKEDTDLWDAQLALSSAATLTDLYVSTSNPSVVQSILLCNNDGANDVKARVVWTDGSNNVQSYLCYDMVVPADSTVELCQKPKYLASGYKLRAYANQADRLEVTASGKQIT